jgi:formylglycine-generating enzyme required for sulfatase activity
MPRVVLLIVLMLPLIVLAEGAIINNIDAPEGGVSEAQAKCKAEAKANAEANANAEAEAADSKTLIPQMVSRGSFATGKYEVTFEEYDRYAQATGSQQSAGGRFTSSSL